MGRDARDSLPDEAGIALRPQAPIRSLMIRSVFGVLSLCRPAIWSLGRREEWTLLFRVASLVPSLARTSTAGVS